MHMLGEDMDPRDPMTSCIFTGSTDKRYLRSSEIRLSGAIRTQNGNSGRPHVLLTPWLARPVKNARVTRAIRTIRTIWVIGTIRISRSVKVIRTVRIVRKIKTVRKIQLQETRREYTHGKDHRLYHHLGMGRSWTTPRSQLDPLPNSNGRNREVPTVISRTYDILSA